MNKKSAGRVVVVGAGVGGMAAAARLAKDGFSVTVIERNDQVGGRARIWQQDGYVFDMGPSWYLMPEVFERFFAHFGKKTADYYELKQLAPSYRVFFGPGEAHDMPAEPTIYVNVTSKVEAADAPPGGENWFVLLNAPRNAGQDWPAAAARARQAMLKRLSRALGCDVGALIQVEKIIAPPDIERDTGSTCGSLYGIASHSPVSAFLRHPNRARRIEGLYFAGGSAHPGGGMPLALLSGMLAAELAEKRES